MTGEDVTSASAAPATSPSSTSSAPTRRVDPPQLREALELALLVARHQQAGVKLPPGCATGDAVILPIGLVLLYAAFVSTPTRAARRWVAAMFYVE
jgi:hypothetical protein